MTTRTTFIRPHDPEDPAAATKAAAIALIAAEYRDRHPLPPLEPYEMGYIKDNTRRLSIYDINTTIGLDDQRAELDASQYVELAILGGEAFLATSERIGTPRALRRFVRRHQLHHLRQLEKLEEESFVKDMKNNTAWIDSLLELVVLLKPVKGHQASNEKAGG
ncbi:hypothetical protein BHE90_017528 [Fusarium euwallaceae]|uniref:Uncharacterized protein n=1 Tax=Fusarium euwallaceae TaxID=1147111 RepID=A0A430KX63_9HYPO|nr:hypothetical protein BHE90_017528 [Fusarium euwallaceae]